jgi:hypothetical protein
MAVVRFVTFKSWATGLVLQVREDGAISWRPAVVPTVGVQYLPGFKDEA